MTKNKKIKICALTTISKTMDWFIVDSMRNLSKNGYEVTLICNMDNNFVNKNKDFANCIPLQMSRGINIRNLIASIFKLTNIFKREKFDIIYYTSPNASMYASIAGILSGIKIRIYSQCGLRYVSFTGIKRKIFKLVEKITCLFSTHIKAQSNKNMLYAINEKLCNSKKISVVGIGGTTGVSIEECNSFCHKTAKQELREKLNIPQNSFIYGYVGRINADKGINELITAFNEVCNKFPSTHLVLVGMTDEANPINDNNMTLAKNHPNIIMTGNVPKNEVYRYMAMFDVLTHPTYREGFGKVLQEAMGMHIPIITTDVPGPSEVIENNISGILCRAKDYNDLKEKMLFLYHNKEIRNSLAEEGYKRAKKYFDRPIMLNNILEDIENIRKEVK